MSKKVRPTSEQETMAIALFRQRQQVLDVAQRDLARLDAAIRELAKMIAGEGRWVFGQDEDGLFVEEAEGEQLDEESMV